MKKKFKSTGILFFVIAIICSLMAVVIAYTQINRITKRQPILVANRYVVAGDPLTKEMFDTVQIPVGGIPQDAIRPNVNLDRLVATKDMGIKDILRYENVADLNEKDLPILSTRLRAVEKGSINSENDEENGEEYDVEKLKNLRAAEIPIDSIIGMLDGMKTGDQIAVTSVFIEETENNEKIRRTETIFDYVRIIGIKPPVDNSKGTLVIALSQKQFEALALAREKGKFYIALMPLGIEKPEDHPEILSELYIEMLEKPENVPVFEEGSVGLMEDD